MVVTSAWLAAVVAVFVAEKPFEYGRIFATPLELLLVGELLLLNCTSLVTCFPPWLRSCCLSNSFPNVANLNY